MSQREIKWICWCLLSQLFIGNWRWFCERQVGKRRVYKLLSTQSLDVKHLLWNTLRIQYLVVKICKVNFFSQFIWRKYLEKLETCQTGKEIYSINAYCWNFRGSEPGASLQKSSAPPPPPILFSLRWQRTWFSGTRENKSLALGFVMTWLYFQSWATFLLVEKWGHEGCR